MTVIAARVTVETTPVELSGVATDTTAGQYLMITNRGTASVFLGAADVTTGSGYEVEAGDSITADLGRGERLYAVAASGSHVLHVLRSGV